MLLDVLSVICSKPGHVLDPGFQPTRPYCTWVGSPLSVFLHYSQANLRLICPSGGCRPITDWRNCYINEAPARAFVSRNTWPSDKQGRVAAARTLLAGLSPTDIASCEWGLGWQSPLCASARCCIEHQRA